MPALRGSLTYARCFVEGELEGDFKDRFIRSIRLRAMKPLVADEEALERSGWCAIGEPFELALDHENVFYNEFINLGFRTDRWVIPGSMMRAKMKEAEIAYLAKKGREKLSKSEKTELKELVARKLRKQLSPAINVCDLSWSLGSGIVRFFSHSVQKTALMTELFQKTFQLKLAFESPFVLAERLGLSKADLASWEALETILLGHPQERQFEGYL